MQPKKLIPYSFAQAKGLFVSSMGEGIAEICVRVGTGVDAIAEARRALGVPVHAVLLDEMAFDSRLSEIYSQADSAVLDDFEQNIDLSRIIEEMPKIEDLLEAEGDAPVIRMINALLTQALRENASDIHFEIFENRSVVRFRLDGTLRDIVEPHRALHAAIVSRIKIMAQLDIAEKRLPQDGRIALRIAGRPVDVRVSTLPTGHGERVVMRLLDKDSGKLDLARLGMSDEALNRVNDLINQPHGIFLVTGPTGSGKTTTLYAALSRIDSLAMNIMTVEDPIEYDLDGIGQTQVNARIEMSFAKALRAILRQDPDVIMIGEIRDLETAQIAVQASLTGHLVLATLHTNDAASAVTRLIDMGIEPFLLASSLIGVLAQRLVRRICKACHGAGCKSCDMSGYKGRTGIYELITVDEELRRFIHDASSEQDIRSHARDAGMKTLREDGMRWVDSGQTTLEELLRVTKD